MTIVSNGNVAKSELANHLDAIKKQNAFLQREVFRIYWNDQLGGRVEIVTVRL